MKIYTNLLFVVCLFFSINFINAQNVKISEQQALNELYKRGLTQDEVQSALAKNGIDTTQLENASPEQIIQIQKIVADLEAQKKKEQENKIEVSKPIEKPKVIDTPNQTPKKPDTVSIVKNDVIYGHELLDLPPVPKSDYLKINDDYIIGPGDKISVSIWSNYSQFDNSYIVDPDGYIKFDKSDLKKRLFVKGLKFNIARSKIEQILSQYMRFNKGEINIALESERNINISIYGEVKSPGTYSINAFLNVFDALKYAQGVTKIGSVRTVKLLSSNGKIKTFDLYKYIADPSSAGDFYLQDNDLIHVPVAEKIVKIEGAVNRPMMFDLTSNEGIKELLTYAGGYTKDAIKDIFIIERFVENKKEVIEININENSGKNFVLKNGDIISVRKINALPLNYYTVSGAVYNPGKFENKKNIRISDALKLAGLMPETKTDFAFLVRKNLDGTSFYYKINIDSVLSNQKNEAIDLMIQNEDNIILWSKSRFADKSYISVKGAVRDAIEKYPYGSVKNIRVFDAIVLAGGLARNASDIAFIYRQDPLKNYEKQYIRINLKKILDDSNSIENFRLLPFDELEVLPQNLFSQSSSVSISGAVNNPGEFQYGVKMTLLDLLTMAGGLKMSGSSNNLEISRIEFKDNNPTKVVVAKIEINRDIINSNDKLKSYILEPHDHVFVRYIPDFEPQKVINITGEVKYPGDYSLTSKNEKVSDIIQRAGGLTIEAFPQGATLYRSLDSTGYIIMRLEDALKSDNSRYNYLLKDGDALFIPKGKDFVTITGATKVYETYKKEIASSKMGINVPFHTGKRAYYYIDNYAGGIDESGDKKSVFVEYPNGEIKKVKNYVFFDLSPKVKKGSIIRVGNKKIKTKEEEKEKDVDWNKIITDSVAQISTIMTLVILFKTLSQ